ncbi:MAG: hypothetical protein DRJ42_03990 [Deltaproteobacteria bacterium]|nr:MAG: hypothetical protein DRJ42_03990 [Deltaproteobacteria bacterium]
MPVTRVSFAVTLDGAALPTVASVGTYGGGPSIALVPVEGWRGAPRPQGVSLYDNASDPSRSEFVPAGSVEIRVSPGEYHVVYRMSEGDSSFTSEWPVAEEARLATLTIDGESETVSLDVPRARVLLTTTLAGAPLPASNQCAWGRSPEIVLARDGFTSRHSLCVGDALGTERRVREAIEVWLLPGTVTLRYRYDLYRFTSRAIDPEWPHARETELLSGVSITDGVTVAIDVPRARFSVAATLAGGALPSVPRMFRSENVELAVHDATGRIFSLPLYEESLDGATWEPADPPSAWVLPGQFTVRYGGSWFIREDEWPPYAAPLDVTVEVLDDTVVAVDVPRVRITASVRLADDPSPCENWAARPAVSIGSMRVLAPSLDEPGPSTRWIVPGTYVVRYSGGGCGDGAPEWPQGGTVLDEALEVRADRTLEYVIPRVRVHLTTTLRGAPLQALPAEPGEWFSYSQSPLLVLRSADPNGFSTWHLPLYSKEGVRLEPIGERDVVLMPGTYSVTYAGSREGTFDADWPHGYGTVVEAFDATSDTTVAVDVGGTRVRATVTLGGREGRADIDESLLAIETLRPDDSAGPSLVVVQSPGEPRASVEAWWMPGTYSLLALTHREPWPALPTPLGCWVIPEH